MRYISSLRQVLWNFARLFSFGFFRQSFEVSITEWEPDIIHAHDTIALPTAFHAARKLGAKLIFDSHELETHRNPPQLWVNRFQTHRIEAKYLPQASKVITVGHKIADYLEQDYAIKRPVVIFNSPPVGDWPIPKKWQRGQRSDVRREAGLAVGTCLMVYTGNIAINRGLEEAIRGLALYHEIHPTAAVHLSIVGQAVGDTLAALKTLAAERGVEDRLRFHDPVAANDVTRFISSANLAVIPIIPETLSYEYAMPNKLFEATLAGLPILGSDLAEMGAFIRQYRLGETYDSRSPEAFSHALGVLLARTKPLIQEDEAQHLKLKEMFGWENQSKTLLEIYRDVLD
jgi:glycogen synthase